MPRRIRQRVPPDASILSFRFDNDQMKRLDMLAHMVGLDRQGVIIRSLYLWETACLLERMPQGHGMITLIGEPET